MMRTKLNRIFKPIETATSVLELLSSSALLKTFPSLSGITLGSRMLGLSDLNPKAPHFRAILGSVLQKTHLSPLFSDHRAAIADLGIKDAKILFLNMMMRCREKTVDGEIVHNNGFKQSETKLQYQERIAVVTREIIQILKEHPEVAVIALQEAPIEPEDIKIMADVIDKFLPGWHAAQFDMTDFGVMTFIRTEKPQHAFYADSEVTSALENEKEKLSTRCQTFTNGTAYAFSNIHVEHVGTRESLRLILKVLVDKAIANKIACHDIVGDFNSDFEQVKAVLQEVWTAKCLELKTHHPALKLEARFDASPKGHKKANGSEIDADGVLSLKFGSAESEKDKFSFEAGRLHYLSAFIFSCTAVASAFVSSEAEISSFGLFGSVRMIGARVGTELESVVTNTTLTAPSIRHHH